MVKTVASFQLVYGLPFLFLSLHNLSILNGVHLSGFLFNRMSSITVFINYLFFHQSQISLLFVIYFRIKMFGFFYCVAISNCYIAHPVVNHIFVLVIYSQRFLVSVPLLKFWYHIK